MVLYSRALAVADVGIDLDHGGPMKKNNMYAELLAIELFEWN